MSKCICGSRPKKGAPPISTLRLQDLVSPNNFIRGVFVGLPSPPSLYSVVWGEGTDAFCARDPDRLNKEFAPYDSTTFTNALKKLWAKNCECAPVIGTWRFDVQFEVKTCIASQGCTTSKFEIGGNIRGAAIGVLNEFSQDANFKRIRVTALLLESNYQERVTMYSQSVLNYPGSELKATHTQKIIIPGCFPLPKDDPPLPSGGYPLANPPSSALPDLPIAWIPDEPKPPKPPPLIDLPPPPPPECC